MKKLIVTLLLTGSFNVSAWCAVPSYSGGSHAQQIYSQCLQQERTNQLLEQQIQQQQIQANNLRRQQMMNQNQPVILDSNNWWD